MVYQDLVHLQLHRRTMQSPKFPHWRRNCLLHRSGILYTSYLCPYSSNETAFQASLRSRYWFFYEALVLNGFKPSSSDATLPPSLKNTCPFPNAGLVLPPPRPEYWPHSRRHVRNSSKGLSHTTSFIRVFRCHSKGKENMTSWGTEQHSCVSENRMDDTDQHKQSRTDTLEQFSSSSTAARCWAAVYKMQRKT